MVQIRNVGTKKLRKKVAVELGLTLDQLERGLGDISNIKNPMIDIDTIIPQLDAYEKAKKQESLQQLREAQETWRQKMIENGQLVHKKTLVDKRPYCWMGEDKGEFIGSRKDDEVTCADCRAVEIGIRGRLEQA